MRRSLTSFCTYDVRRPTLPVLVGAGRPAGFSRQPRAKEWRHPRPPWWAAAAASAGQPLPDATLSAAGVVPGPEPQRQRGGLLASSLADNLATTPPPYRRSTRHLPAGGQRRQLCWLRVSATPRRVIGGAVGIKHRGRYRWQAGRGGRGGSGRRVAVPLLPTPPAALATAWASTADLRPGATSARVRIAALDDGKQRQSASLGFLTWQFGAGAPFPWSSAPAQCPHRITWASAPAAPAQKLEVAGRCSAAPVASASLDNTVYHGGRRRHGLATAPPALATTPLGGALTGPPPSPRRATPSA
jgi:hypothetical protein